MQVLSKVFRAKILSSFEEVFNKGKLKFMGEIEYLDSYTNFKELLVSCASKEFVVYAKEPFLGPEQVIKYLGQYTHRIAISNYRLLKLEDEMICFKVRDQENPGKSKIMKLHVKEFMRRFLLHVLPKRYVRIRHFGLLGSRLKKLKIAIVRRLNKIKERVVQNAEEGWKAILQKATGIDIELCPKCKHGKLVEALRILPALNSS